jgi:hypothetical protein
MPEGRIWQQDAAVSTPGALLVCTHSLTTRAAYAHVFHLTGSAGINLRGGL